MHLCLKNIELLSQISVHLFAMQRHKGEIKSSRDTDNDSEKESSE